ncbi:MAG: hypothetical protein K8R91_05805 [Phycisphaerae bacterium]|nr:hypothetical protein [Phycisphaerae bacterium]
MTKFFNKWTRIIHRWFAIPTLIIIPLAVINKFSGGKLFYLPPQIEPIQSILMLLLAISGAYLYLIPYITKWKRNKRKKSASAK